MFRRGPCDLYLIYLILLPEHLTDVDIELRCAHEQLDHGTRVHVRSIRRRVHPPQPFRPFDRYHDPSRLFLERHKVRLLFEPDRPTTEARGILESSRAKEYVETQTLAGAPRKAIAKRLCRRFLPCSEEGVERYQRFFFSIDHMSVVECRQMVEQRYIPPPSIVEEMGRDPEMRSYMVETMKMERRHYWRDPLRLAAEMPRSPYSAMVAGMYLGDEPNMHDMPKLWQNTMMLTAARIAEEVRMGERGAGERFRDWGGGFKAIQESLLESGSAGAEMDQELRALRLATKQDDIKLIENLTGGRVSSTVHRTPEDPEPVDR